MSSQKNQGIEDISVEVIQSGEKKEKIKMSISSEKYKIVANIQTLYIYFLSPRRRGGKKGVEENIWIMAQKFPNLMKKH